MMTYNLGKIINCKQGLPSGSKPGVCGFMVIAESNFAPHELFISSLCSQNNILVMLSVFYFIMDRRSSENCMASASEYGDCHNLKVCAPLIY